MHLLAIVTVFRRTAGGRGGVGVSLAGSAASSGALTSFFWFCLGFLGIWDQQSPTFSFPWGVFWEQAFPSEQPVPQHKCEIVSALC